MGRRNNGESEEEEEGDEDPDARVVAHEVAEVEAGRVARETLRDKVVGEVVAVPAVLHHFNPFASPPGIC